MGELMLRHCFVWAPLLHLMDVWLGITVLQMLLHFNSTWHGSSPAVTSLSLSLSLSQACFAGGMFGLGSQHAIDGQAAHYLDIGKAVTSTCHLSYNSTGKIHTKVGLI